MMPARCGDAVHESRGEIIKRGVIRVTSRNSEANRAASSRKLVGSLPTAKAVVRSALLGLSAVALAAPFAVPTSVPAAADPPLHRGRGQGADRAARD